MEYIIPRLMYKIKIEAKKRYSPVQICYDYFNNVPIISNYLIYFTILDTIGVPLYTMKTDELSLFDFISNIVNCYMNNIRSNAFYFDFEQDMSYYGILFSMQTNFMNHPTDCDEDEIFTFDFYHIKGNDKKKLFEFQLYTGEMTDFCTLIEEYLNCKLNIDQWIEDTVY